MKRFSRCVGPVLMFLMVFSATQAFGGESDPGEASESTLAVIPVQDANYEYRTYAQVEAELGSIEAQHSDIARVYDIGDSWEKTQNISDRDILALKISDNVDDDEDEPEILIMALHHAREWISCEIVMEAIANLTDHYGSDARTSWLVDNREIWLVPVVNPDGLDYSLSSDQWWRKNRRLNYDGSYGVDLNRNYGGSMNNDSAGEWGGVGSSHTPSDLDYCGIAPFSEPETQAIRDLVLQREFEMCLDFHSYGRLVMWPWGYTSNLTSDNDAFVSIGTQLAALNGYTPDQSVGLYPTTGDSLDWLYGYDRIFAILFEVATSFHPTTSSMAEGVIAENIPPILLAVEIAGDRLQSPFSIEHFPAATREYSPAGFEVLANITSDRGVNESTSRLVFRVDHGAWMESAMLKTTPEGVYAGTIQPELPGSLVEYYIVAHDVGGVELMSPRYAPYEVHSFVVIDSVPPVADAGADVSVLRGDYAVLNASGSSDNAFIANYTWSFWYDGRQVLLFGGTVAFTFSIAGTYEVHLTVTDSSGNSDEDTMVVSVEDNGIPEFGSSLTLVIVAAGLVLVLSARRRTTHR